MNELAAILSRLREGGPGTDDAVLATVVHVRGSSYRRPGARMLVLADGTRIGTISGGCLERDVARKAWWWTDEGTTVRIFDSTTEDAARDFGLGCNGVITVLLERADTPSARELVRFLQRRQLRREDAVVCTVVRAEAGSRFALGDRVLVAQDGIVPGAQHPAAVLAAEAVRAAFAERRSRLVHLDEGDVFVEWIAPPRRLFVFGSGHDVAPLTTIAAMMGWSTTVAAFRTPHFAAMRFPDAENVFAIPADGDLSELGLTADDAVVVMSHNFAEDAALLPQILDASPCYVGLLGPRSRAEKLFAEIGREFAGDNLHAPVGLALGGDHPEAIALSIASELQAVLHGQDASQLRRTRGAIHAPAVEVGAEAEGRSWSPEQTVVPVCALRSA